MSAKKIKDLCVVTRKYTDREGKEKSNYLNIGAIIQKDDGGKFMILNRHFNPAGIPNPENKDTLIVSMFDVKDKNDNGQQSEQSSSAQESLNNSEHFDDSEIPF